MRGCVVLVPTALLGLVGGCLLGSCRLDRDTVRQQRELLERFHDRGVIADATYQKTLAAIEGALRASAARRS